MHLFFDVRGAGGCLKTHFALCQTIFVHTLFLQVLEASHFADIYPRTHKAVVYREKRIRRPGPYAGCGPYSGPPVAGVPRPPLWGAAATRLPGVSVPSASRSARWRRIRISLFVGRLDAAECTAVQQVVIDENKKEVVVSGER